VAKRGAPVLFARADGYRLLASGDICLFFLADSFKQISLLADTGDVDIQYRRDPFLRGTTLDSFYDHKVFLDGGHRVHALVVGVGFIVHRDQAAYVRLSKLPQGFEPDVAIQQPEIVSVDCIFGRQVSE
jgi:hypothetical protein